MSKYVGLRSSPAEIPWYSLHEENIYHYLRLGTLEEVLLIAYSNPYRSMWTGKTFRLKLEYTDMILIYGKVNKNGLAAVQEYRDTFPHQRTPDRKTFEAVERRLRETGSFKPKRIDTGRQRSARNYNNEQAIINVELSPTTSTRRLSRQLNICQSSVCGHFMKHSCTHSI
ncbi:hypothetical protein J6590_103816 [Homalodisca vitripennis]|nr:hypothetical protein J6590_103816 [Homalodisca vitripennis]